MKLIELFESQLEPNQIALDNLEFVLDNTQKLYRSVQDQTARETPDYDPTEFDADLWINALKHTTNENNIPFIWNLSGEDQGKKPVNKYLHSMNVHSDGVISFNLYAPHMENGLNFEEFKMVLMRYMEHEAIHLAQRDKMGHDVFAGTSSEFQKAQGMMASTDDKVRKKGLRLYLSDPQEITAYARDLSNEIQSLTNPKKAIYSINKYIKQLPTWHKYSEAGFKENDVVLKRLLKQTFIYLRRAGIL